MEKFINYNLYFMKKMMINYYILVQQLKNIFLIDFKDIKNNIKILKMKNIII